MHKANWLKIGVVGRAHGLRGHFFIPGRTEALPDDYDVLLIGEAPESSRSWNVVESELRTNGVIVLCEGINRREDLDLLTGKAIWVNRDSVAVDDSLEYLWEDLIGKQVLDQDGLIVGEICDVYNHGASDVVEIRGTEGKRLDIAFISEYFDMGFSPKDKSVNLVVPAETFSELWN